jgi:hypothetical protein
MNASIEAQLTQDANKLNELNRLVVKAVVEWNTNELLKTVQEYVNIKRKIKTTALIDYPFAKTHDRVDEGVLKKISQEEHIQADMDCTTKTEHSG